MVGLTSYRSLSNIFLYSTYISLTGNRKVDLVYHQVCSTVSEHKVNVGCKIASEGTCPYLAPCWHRNFTQTCTFCEIGGSITSSDQERHRSAYSVFTARLWKTSQTETLFYPPSWKPSPSYFIRCCLNGFLIGISEDPKKVVLVLLESRWTDGRKKKKRGEIKAFIDPAA